MTIRLNVNLNDETGAQLRRCAEEEGRTVTEVIRRAVGVYMFVREECVVGDKQLKLESRDGTSMIVTLI